MVNKLSSSSKNPPNPLRVAVLDGTTVTPGCWGWQGRFWGSLRWVLAAPAASFSDLTSISVSAPPRGCGCFQLQISVAVWLPRTSWRNRMWQTLGWHEQHQPKPGPVREKHLPHHSGDPTPRRILGLRPSPSPGSFAGFPAPSWGVQGVQETLHCKGAVPGHCLQLPRLFLPDFRGKR